MHVLSNRCRGLERQLCTVNRTNMRFVIIVRRLSWPLRNLSVATCAYVYQNECCFGAVQVDRASLFARLLCLFFGLFRVFPTVFSVYLGYSGAGFFLQLYGDIRYDRGQGHDFLVRLRC